jgi:hypothetical protein
LFSSPLVIPNEADELALALNGRQNRLGCRGFLAFADYLHLHHTSAQRKIKQLLNLQDAFDDQIAQSSLNSDLKYRFAKILAIRLKRLA